MLHMCVCMCVFVCLCVCACEFMMNQYGSNDRLCSEEKRKLLRQWVLSGQNLQACESAIEISQESGVRGEKIWMQIPVKNMHRKPHYFSESFDSI